MQHGMHKTGQHFTEGTQYETALLHQRMRNRQPGRIDHPVVIKKNIDIGVREPYCLPIAS